MKATRDNTHKKKIIEKIFNKLGLPRSLIGKIIDDVFIVLISNINSKKSIKIKNFGTFLLKKKNKRIGRSPKNGIEHTISERNVLTFRAADDLRKKINRNVEK